MASHEKLIPSVELWEMAIIDHLIIDTYHISLILMMENAGSALAALAVEMMQDKPHPRTVVVLDGKGGNGDTTGCVGMVLKCDPCD